MRVIVAEDLCIGDETCSAIRPESGEMEEERAWVKIAGQGEPSADLERVEACPVEAIIRSWRQLRRTLQRPSPIQNSLLAIR